MFSLEICAHSLSVHSSWGSNGVLTALCGAEEQTSILQTVQNDSQCIGYGQEIYLLRINRY